MSSIKNHWFSVPAVLLVLLFARGSAISQTVTGTISGMVVDSSGAIMAGTTVRLVNEQTGFSRTASTNEEGRFSFAAVQPGTYTVKVEHQGFQTLEKQSVVLSANEVLPLGNLQLNTGQVSETVTVTTQGSVVEKESSDLTARLTADQIALISTKGRDITSLLRLLPGTSNDDDIEAVGEGFGTNLPNISGQRGRSTVASIDGLNASEPSGSNKLSMTINQDAVAEVKVLRNNYGAEYGNNGGAIINLVTKGGTKDYQGSAYYFLRNEALNATPFFTNKAGLPRPLYRHNIWGFTVGGPVQIPKLLPNKGRDRVFFFFSLEKPHTITPTDPVFVTMPTALERQGNFSQTVDNTGKPVVIVDPKTGQPFAGNIIPPERINKSGQALLNYFPLPNTPGGKTLAGASYNYVFQKSVDVPKHSYVTRIDVRPSNNDSVYWKAQWWTSDNEGTGTSGWPGGDANRWGISSHYLYADNGMSANWVHIFGPALVNEFNLGLRHDTEGFIPSNGVTDKLTRAALNYAAPQLFPQNNHLDLIPRVTGWTSVAGTAANINWLDRWGEAGKDYILPSIADNLSYIRGNHSYKFGLYFERLLNREAPGGNWSGTFNFGTSSGFTTSLGSTGYAYANALLGNFNSYSEQTARPFTNNEIRLLQWYAQDQWKVSSRLTLNYGLRLSYHSPFFQRDGQGSNFDPSRFDRAKAPLLYMPYCIGGTPATSACSGANRRAVDPRNLPNPTAAQLLTNTNLVGTFVPGTGDLGNGMVLSTDPTATPGFRSTNKIDLEPRVGIAWDLRGDGRTVLRMMGGVYHAPRVGGGTGGASSLGGNPPLQRSFSVGPCAGCNVDNVANVIGGALNSPSTVAAVEVNSKTPTTYNYTLGLQREVGYKTVVEVAYVGSQSRHLGERRNINQVPDNAHFIDLNPLGPNCLVKGNAACSRNPFSNTSINGIHTLGVLGDSCLRPYKGYGDINQTTWSG